MHLKSFEFINNLGSFVFLLQLFAFVFSVITVISTFYLRFSNVKIISWWNQNKICPKKVSKVFTSILFLSAGLLFFTLFSCLCFKTHAYHIAFHFLNSAVARVLYTILFYNTRMINKIFNSESSKAFAHNENFTPFYLRLENPAALPA